MAEQIEVRVGRGRHRYIGACYRRRRRRRYIGACFGSPGLGKTLSAGTYAAAGIDQTSAFRTHTPIMLGSKEEYSRG